MTSDIIFTIFCGWTEYVSSKGTLEYSDVKLVFCCERDKSCRLPRCRETSPAVTKQRVWFKEPNNAERVDPSCVHLA